MFLWYSVGSGKVSRQAKKRRPCFAEALRRQWLKLLAPTTMLSASSSRLLHDAVCCTS